MIIKLKFGKSIEVWIKNQKILSIKLKAIKKIPFSKLKF